MAGPLRDPSPGAHRRLGAELADQPAGRAPAAQSVRHVEIDVDEYDGWTVRQLRRRAAELDVPGRSGLRRADLIQALRAR